MSDAAETRFGHAGLDTNRTAVDHGSGRAINVAHRRSERQGYTGEELARNPEKSTRTAVCIPDHAMISTASRKLLSRLQACGDVFNRCFRRMLIFEIHLYPNKFAGYLENTDVNFNGSRCDPIGRCELRRAGTAAGPRVARCARAPRCIRAGLAFRTGRSRSPGTVR